MWRGLDEEERNMLVANYKFGGGVLKVFCGIWFGMCMLFCVSGLPLMIESFMNKDIFDSICRLIGTLFILAWGTLVPRLILKRGSGKEELRAIENGEARVADGYLAKMYRKRRKKGKYQWRAVVQVNDGLGACEMFDCRALNLQYGIPIGSRVSVIMPNPNKKDELLAYQKVVR